jgi:KaiC/GvpD/RAD55 family RecA-like ATPase
MVRLPFLEPLLPEGIGRGKAVGVFFTPASEWRVIVTAVVASRLRANLRAGILTTTRFPREIAMDLARFGVDAQKAIEAGSLRIADWYTCITGHLPPDPPDDMATSLRVEDLGLITSKYWHVRKGIEPESTPDFIELAVFDNLTRLFNYNDERACVKFLYTTIARMKQDRRLTICGFAKGVLEKQVYNDLESMFDGIVDVRRTKEGGGICTVVRVRSFPETLYTKAWFAVRARADSVSLVAMSNLGDPYQAARPFGNHQSQ